MVEMEGGHGKRIVKTTDLKMLGIVNAIMTLLMERGEADATLSKLFSVATIIVARLNNEEPPRFSDDPEAAHLYLLLRRMVRKGMFDAEVMSYLIKVTRELR